MHTRKRALAGVTAGALALGVLAFSPVAPASATQPAAGATNPYLVGSLVKVDKPAALTASGTEAVAAYITTTATVSVYGRQRTASPPDPTVKYENNPRWDDITPTDAVAFKSGTDYIGIKSSLATPATVTIKFFVDKDDDGAIDANEENLIAPTVVQFVNPSDVSVAVTTDPVGSAQAYTNVGFYATPVVGVNPLLQDESAAIAGVSGRAVDWTTGSWASLNGDTPVPAKNDPLIPAGAISVGPPLVPPVSIPAETPNFPVDGVIYAGNTGSIAVTGWFDPTGTVWPTGTWDTVPSAPPASQPTDFKVGSATVRIGSQQLSIKSTMTASGTGVVADGPYEYSAPLSTTSATFELTAVRTDPLDPSSTLPYAAGTPVQIKLVGDYRAVADTGPETFAVNSVAVNKANLFNPAVGIVVPGITDANGKVQVVVSMTTLSPGITDLLAITASLVKIDGQAAPTFLYTSATPLSILCSFPLPSWLAAASGCLPAAGPLAIQTTVVWNKAGRVSNWKTTGTLNGLPFTGGTVDGGGVFYSAVESNSVGSLVVDVVDTFGNPVPGRSVKLTSNPAFAGSFVGGTTGATGQVTFGVPGLATGYRILTLTDDAENRPIAGGVILYKPKAQMTAGGIAAPPRQRQFVTEGTDVPNWTAVTFRVIDSVGDPMSGVIGVVTTSLGVVVRAPAGTLVGALPVSGNIVNPNGTLTVYVASKTVGTANVTLSIGGKSATAKVDFTNRNLAASTLSLALAGGGKVPKSVMPRTETRMQVSATDANGNPLQGAYILIKVKGDARTRSGGRQAIVFTGQNGTATFIVRSAKAGSFEVVAKADRYVEGMYITGGWWEYNRPYLFNGPVIKARTGVINIKS